MRLEFDIDLDKSLELDLLQLIPEKFHNSVLLKQLVEELSQLVGGWLMDTRDMGEILDSETAPADYLRHLGSLIDVTLLDEDDRTEEQWRREIGDAIAWYKLKGTYEAFVIIARLIGYNINLRDMYTNDYSTFVMVDTWFVGEEDENPPGFDSSYYKSPHFGFDILLDTEHAGESGEFPYLWQITNIDDAIKYVERVRPINTVPHFVITVQPTLDLSYPVYFETSDSGMVAIVITVVEGGIVTALLVELTGMSIIYFDEEQTDFGREIYFDDSVDIYNFDQGSGESILAIDAWKLGTGHKCADSDERQRVFWEPSFELENIVLTGGSENISVDNSNPDVTIYRVTIPETTVLDGVSELALYVEDEMVIAALFPDIFKGTQVELHIDLYVLKT